MQDNPCADGDLNDEECRIVKRIDNIALHVEEIQRILNLLNNEITQSDWYFLQHQGQLREDARSGNRNAEYTTELDKDSERYYNDLRRVLSLVARARMSHIVREIHFLDDDEDPAALH